MPVQWAPMGTILSVTPLYEGWLDLLMLRLRIGDDEMDRHVVKAGRGVAVLPYDPERRTALLVSMPRPPVMLQGEPDMLEAIAGLLDTDVPEEDARREAMEEAGVRLDALDAIGQFWSIPGFATEKIDYFLARYAAADRIAAGGGHPDEQEHILVHEVALDELWSMFERHEIKDAKLAILLMALRVREAGLFLAG